MFTDWWIIPCIIFMVIALHFNDRIRDKHGPVKRIRFPYFFFFWWD